MRDTDRVFDCIRDLGPLTQGEICKERGLSPGEAWEAILELVECGLLFAGFPCEPQEDFTIFYFIPEEIIEEEGNPEDSDDE